MTRIFQFSRCNSIPQVFPVQDLGHASGASSLSLPWKHTLPGPREIVRPVRSHPRGKSNQLSLPLRTLPLPCRGCRKRIQVDRYGRRRGTQGVISIAGIIEPWGALNEPSSSFSSSSLCVFFFSFSLIIRCWSYTCHHSKLSPLHRDVKSLSALILRLARPIRASKIIE